eukprot:2510937-Pleurochrysis_carterae.AAC.1
MLFSADDEGASELSSIPVQRLTKRVVVKAKSSAGRKLTAALKEAEVNGLDMLEGGSIVESLAVEFNADGPAQKADGVEYRCVCSWYSCFIRLSSGCYFGHHSELQPSCEQSRDP